MVYFSADGESNQTYQTKLKRETERGICVLNSPNTSSTHLLNQYKLYFLRFYCHHMMGWFLIDNTVQWLNTFLEVETYEE